MTVEIRVPSVGESVAEAAIAEWLHGVGDWVKEDQTVAVLETDKANMELPAPVSGRLIRVLKQAGEVVEVGEVIGEMEEAEPPAEPAPQDREGTSEPVGEEPEPRREAKVEELPGKRARGEEVRTGPAARRLLAARGLTPDQVRPTGRGGLITKEDVLRHARRTPAAARQEERVRMSPLRKRVAARLVEAQATQALLTTFNEVEMTAVMELRRRHQAAFAEKYGIKLGLMSFFVKASIEALKAFPELNARIEGDEIVFHNYYDIAVAVGTERGLVTPVVRNAERLSFAEVERAIAELASRARSGRLALEELQGGTFTISNGGIYGSLLSTPIVNPPQSGILGMHRIEERPVARGGRVVIRPMMYLALTYDHRLVDGREAVGFLARVKECLEEPARMLLEV